MNYSLIQIVEKLEESDKHSRFGMIVKSYSNR